MGVSIEIPPPYEAELRAWRRRSGDALAEHVNPHVTLVPPTPVPDDGLDRILGTLRERCAAVPPFEMKLRGTGTFRPVSDVVFIAVAEGISSCEVLADRLLVDELRAPRSFPYHPHVTVAQDVDPEALDAAFEGLEGFRADLLVDHVWAHRQDGVGTWHPLARFPLAGVALP